MSEFEKDEVPDWFDPGMAWVITPEGWFDLDGWRWLRVRLDREVWFRVDEDGTQWLREVGDGDGTGGGKQDWRTQLLCTVDEARDWLRIDEEDLDPALVIAIAGASRLIMDYVKRHRCFRDDEIPGDLKMACVTFVGIMIRDPDAVESASWTQGYLPNAVMNQLYMRRTPTLA
ncbi:head-tail connector protein [Paraburkholderia sp. BR14263]|uniref:head-tail connector protein n=1 Tax=unclassified Paraburkholderia TaxID=2615204 RepID=UPI0034CE7760